MLLRAIGQEHEGVDGALTRPDSNTVSDIAAMNDESVNGQRSAADIAADFLARNGLV